MQNLINSWVEVLKSLVETSPYGLGIILGMLMIVTESILPMLPLGVFIALNMVLFGNVLGFFMSYIATIIGCIIMFTINRKLFKKYLDTGLEKKIKVGKVINGLDQINFSVLVLITALPFTPAFLINISAGLSNMTYKKFIANLFIAKLAIVYFWGYIGTTFLGSVTDMKVIIKLVLMLLVAYILSKIVMKKQKIN